MDKTMTGMPISASIVAVEEGSTRQEKRADAKKNVFSLPDQKAVL
jgi:hypothetical protein